MALDLGGLTALVLGGGGLLVSLWTARNNRIAQKAKDQIEASRDNANNQLETRRVTREEFETLARELRQSLEDERELRQGAEQRSERAEERAQRADKQATALQREVSAQARRIAQLEQLWRDKGETVPAAPPAPSL